MPAPNTQVVPFSLEGDGEQLAFTLPVAPSSAANVLVFVGPNRKIPVTDYNTSGTTLTFIYPPGVRVPVHGLVIEVLDTDQIADTVLDAVETGILEQAYVAPTVTADAAAALYASPLQAGWSVPIYSRDPNEQLPPGQLTMLMTAIVALDTLVLNDLLWGSATITVQAGDLTGLTSQNLQAADVLTMRYAISDMLVGRSNVAAKAIARTMGALLDPTAPDPVARFVQEMNVKASSLGCDNTTFTDPHGIDATVQKTTAVDMGMIVAAASTYAQINIVWKLATDSLTVTGPASRSIALTSPVNLVSDSDVIGGVEGTVAGTYNAALFVQMPNGNRAAIVVLGASSDAVCASEARAIIDAVRTGLYWPVVLPTPHGGSQLAYGVPEVASIPLIQMATNLIRTQKMFLDFRAQLQDLL